MHSVDFLAGKEHGIFSARQCLHRHEHLEWRSKESSLNSYKNVTVTPLTHLGK